MDVLRRHNVVVEGRGARTLMFAHGFGCDQRVWRRIVPSFLDDHRVVLFDFAGAGRSDRSACEPGDYRSLDAHARDVVEIARALDLRDAVFVGHSVGAMIGVLAAIADPARFERLVLLAPSPRYLNDPPDYHGGFERKDVEDLLALMDRNFIGWAGTFAQVACGDPELARELADSFRSVDPRTIRAFAETVFYSDHRADLPNVPVPALVVQCADDDIAPVSVGEYTRDHLRNASYRLLDVSGHMPHLSNAEEVRAVLREYLAEPVG